MKQPAILLIKNIEVETPIAKAKGVELMEKIGLVPILRSGLGYGCRVFGN